MAIPHAKPGEVVDVRPLGSALASAQMQTLVRAEQVEVIRLVVPAGKEIEQHKAKGEIVVHCLEGRVVYSGRRTSTACTTRASALPTSTSAPPARRRAPP